MNVLCMDSSGPVCGVAVIRGEKLCFEAMSDVGKTHSQQLMPLVDLALTASGCSVKDLDLLAVIAGPGSFTGVRIGVAAAKGLASPFSIPCVSLNALEVLAEGAREVDGLLCPMLDARAGQVYSAVYRRAGGALTRVLPDAAQKLDELLESLAQLGSGEGTGGEERALTPYFLGDGVEAHRAAIERAMPEARFATPASAGIRAGCGAWLAMGRMNEAVAHGELMPIYLRAPQAERERAAREGK